MPETKRTLRKRGAIECNNSDSTDETIVKKQKVSDSKAVNKQKVADGIGQGSIPLMLANKFEVGDDDFQAVKGWLMSEKLDGVRCYWNGRTMYTRNGNKFYPPESFLNQLPRDIALDGELWSKRGDFQKIISTVKKQDNRSEEQENKWK